MFSPKSLGNPEKEQFYRMMDEIQSNTERIAELEERNRDLKATVERYFDEDGYKDDYVTVSYRKPSERNTIDTARIKTDDRKLYNELFVKYGKTIKVSGGFSYKFKEDED